MAFFLPQGTLAWLRGRAAGIFPGLSLRAAKGKGAERPEPATRAGVLFATSGGPDAELMPGQITVAFSEGNISLVLMHRWKCAFTEALRHRDHSGQKVSKP
jgi:hypothetical protein